MVAVAAVAASAAVGSGLAAAKDGHGLLGLEGPFGLAVDLRGHQVVPGPGDMDGRAALGLNTDTRQNRICWELHSTRLDPITGASLHRGGARQAAAPQIVLFEDPAGRPGKGEYRGCVGDVTPRAIRQIWRSLGREGGVRDWYAEVRTTAFPAGAVRGVMGAGIPCPDCVLEPANRGGR
jgi:hypothetical protein